MTRLPLLLASVLAAGTALAQDSTPHPPADYDFVVADVDAHEVVRYARDGTRTWVYTEVRAIDAWPLPGGEMLMAYLPSERTSGQGGVRIVGRDKRTVMDHPVDDEVMSCLLLPNGNILFTECQAGRLTELDRTGKVLRSFDVKAKGRGHQTVRFIRLTPEHTILAAECYSHVLREYSLEGRFIREFELQMAYCGYRLDNGNTLISGYQPPRIVELDPEQRVVWELSGKDLPADMGLVNFCEVHRLPNGNTLVSNCIRSNVPDQAVLFEVSPDKNVVWQFRDSMRIKGVTAVKPSWNREPGPPPPVQ